MKIRCKLPPMARCIALAMTTALIAGSVAAASFSTAPAPPPADFQQHPGQYDQVDPRAIAHVQSQPLTPALRPPVRGDDLYQRIDYSRPLPIAASPKAVCDIAQFAQATPEGIVAVVKAATVACVNENFGANGALDAAIFTEAKMTAVAQAFGTTAQTYPGNNSTQITQLIMFLRTGYYATGRSTLSFNTVAFSQAMATSMRTFADSPNLTAPASAEHGYALRDFLMLLRSAQISASHLDTMTRVLDAYVSAPGTHSYRNFTDMREAVNYVFSLTYYLQWESGSDAVVIASDQGVRTALRDFVLTNFDEDYGSNREYLVNNAAFELGRFLRLTDPTFLAQTRTLVKSLTDEYSMDHGRNVFLKLAEMINYFDSTNCAWYGASVCSAMQDLMDEILPPTQTRVCHDGQLRIRNNDLTTTQLDYICESLEQQKSSFLTLMAVTADQPVANDHNDTLEVVLFRNQSHYTSYSGTFFGNSTNNGGIYLEGNPATPGNLPRFITFIAPSHWTQPTGVWEPWNLHHEYTHYLDGRYNFHGGFNALPGTAPYSAVWFTEGVGEYMAQFFLSNLPASQFPAIADAMALSFLTRNDESVWFVGTEPARNVPLSTVFNNQYSISPQDNIYVWGYLATRFMFERYRSDIDAMLALARVGDYAPGYRTWLDNARNGKDQEFRTWLDCYLLNTGDTVPCNQDVASRLFKDDFEGQAPPPPPVHVPVNLPLCSSASTLGNACKIEGLQASGNGVAWVSVLPPANVKTLWIKARNGMGDVDLHVGISPTWPYPETPDTFTSTEVGNTEQVRIDAPATTWHNIGLHAKNQDYFSGVDIYAYWLLEGDEDIDPSFGAPVDPEEPEPGENPDPIPDVSHLPECDTDYILATDCKITGLGANGASGKNVYFQIVAGAIPATATIRSFNGTGNADMFYNPPGMAYPTPTAFDTASTYAGNNETIVLAGPVVGYHNVALYPKDGGAFSDVTVVVIFEAEDEEEPGEPEFPDLPECTASDLRVLEPGCQRSDAEQENATWFTWFLTYVQPGSASMTITTSGGSGDADMYVGEMGQWPNATEYAQLSDNVGNAESITIAAPASGWYYIGLRPKSESFSGVSIYVTHD